MRGGFKGPPSPGDVGLDLERVFGHRVVGAADAHFAVAGANVQSGLEDEGASELLDLRELPGSPFI